jgi:hypothetical protein
MLCSKHEYARDNYAKRLTEFLQHHSRDINGLMLYGVQNAEMDDGDEDGGDNNKEVPLKSPLNDL